MDLFPAMSGAATRRLIDVRSPGEVARGAIPGSVAIPILDDEERHAVGVTYAEEGQGAAVERGRILTEVDMPRRQAAWRDAAREMPSAFFCWRGGMRSEFAQQFADVPDTPRVEGGYKALRAHLVASLGTSLARRTPFVVTGPTGSGKTDLLSDLTGTPDLLALDLEAAANHRGSAFGTVGPQPAQATFEHRLALPLLLGAERFVLLEDESRNVGSVHLPAEVFDVVRTAPLLVLESSDEERLTRIHEAYAVEPANQVGIEATLTALSTAILKLRKRLGGEVADSMVAALEDAAREGAWEDREAFRPVVLPLLHAYYDPLYRKATPQEGRRIAARGSREELRAWLSRHLEEAA